MGPDDLTFKVHGIESQAAEVTVDEFAVSDGGFGGVRILKVNRGFGLSFVNVLVPESFTGVEIEADHFPKVGGLGDF